MAKVETVGQTSSRNREHQGKGHTPQPQIVEGEEGKRRYSKGPGHGQWEEGLVRR